MASDGLERAVNGLVALLIEHTDVSTREKAVACSGADTASLKSVLDQGIIIGLEETLMLAADGTCV